MPVADVVFARAVVPITDADIKAANPAAIIILRFIFITPFLINF